MSETPEFGTAYTDTVQLRACLDRIHEDLRDPTASEVLKILDGLLQLIERRDQRDLDRQLRR